MLAYDGIQFWKFLHPAFDFGKCNATADIDADDVWQDRAAKRCGKTDCSDFSRVHIGHNPDVTAFECRVITEILQLRNGVAIDAVFG